MIVIIAIIIAIIYKLKNVKYELYTIMNYKILFLD